VIGFDKIPPWVDARLLPGEDSTMGELFGNRQWKVTDYGLECVNGRYDIEASRLTEATIDGTIYDWPFHKAEKEWLAERSLGPMRCEPRSCCWPLPA
jgi:hypothetical protein